MRRLALLTIVFAGLYSNTSAQAAAPDYEVLPVQLVKITSDSVSVSFSLPCGNHFEGFLLRWEGAQHLKVGLVTSVGEVLCAGFPQVMQKDIKSIDTSKLQSVVSISDVDVRDQFKIIAPLDIRKLAGAGAGKLSRVQMVYETRCGLFEGFVYRETEAGKIEIAIAERLSHDAESKSCAFHQEVVSMTAPRSETEETQIRPISLSKVNIRKDFELSLAPIVPSTLKSDAKEGIKFEYTRNCRQAPVGLVLSSPKGPKDRRVVVVGMVVAEFYNIDCDVKAAPVRESFADAALQLPADYLPEVYASEVVENFTLKQPTQYATESQASSSFDYLQGCGKIYGAVYSRDKNGDLAVGVLEASEDSNCRRPAREVTLAQPYFTHRGFQVVVFPMKIKGTRAANL